MGLSHCRHNGLVTVGDEARLRLGHNDQSHRGHQCSETMLTEESRFHISTPLGIEPGSLMTGSKGLTHWISEAVCECSEIAGSPHYQILKVSNQCEAETLFLNSGPGKWTAEKIAGAHLC